MNGQEADFVKLCALGIDSSSSAIFAGYEPKEAAAFAFSMLERDDIQNGITTERERNQREYKRLYAEAQETAERLLSEPIEA